MSYSYIIDSSAWVEYFAGTPRGAKLGQLIGATSSGTSVFAIAELADKFEREKRPIDQCVEFIQTRTTILPVTIPLALAAGKIKQKLKLRHPKAGLGDAIHLATAQQESAVLVTTDSDFAGEESVLLIER